MADEIKPDPGVENSSGEADMERYIRQLFIPGWNEKVQKKLACAHVTIAGAGGLGSPVLLYLAAVGIGEIHIIDRDTVSLSNLNRQILYHEGDIGASKARTAARHLSVFNSSIHIDCTEVSLTRENIEEVLTPTHVIVDCLDNYPGRFLLNSWAVARGVPLIHAGIQGFFGQMTVIIPGQTPCLECLYPGLRDQVNGEGKKIPTPVIGAVAGVIGSLQALEVIKIITGIGEPCAHRLLIYDGLSARFEEIEIKRDADCSVCGLPGKDKV